MSFPSFSSLLLTSTNFSEKEREQAGISDACGCLWMYLAEVRASEGSSHAHYNLFYDPLKHDGPLLPPAAALAPTVWPQFHLRWACPSEAQGGEVEAECRKLTRKFSELQRVNSLFFFSLQTPFFSPSPKRKKKVSSLKLQSAS